MSSDLRVAYRRAYSDLCALISAGLEIHHVLYLLNRLGFEVNWNEDFKRYDILADFAPVDPSNHVGQIHVGQIHTSEHDYSSSATLRIHEHLIDAVSGH